MDPATVAIVAVSATSTALQLFGKDRGAAQAAINAQLQAIIKIQLLTLEAIAKVAADVAKLPSEFAQQDTTSERANDRFACETLLEDLKKSLDDLLERPGANVSDNDMSDYVTRAKVAIGEPEKAIQFPPPYLESSVAAHLHTIALIRAGFDVVPSLWAIELALADRTGKVNMDRVASYKALAETCIDLGRAFIDVQAEHQRVYWLDAAETARNAQRNTYPFEQWRQTIEALVLARGDRAWVNSDPTWGNTWSHASQPTAEITNYIQMAHCGHGARWDLTVDNVHAVMPMVPWWSHIMRAPLTVSLRAFYVEPEGALDGVVITGLHCGEPTHQWNPAGHYRPPVPPHWRRDQIGSGFILPVSHSSGDLLPEFYCAGGKDTDRDSQTDAVARDSVRNVNGKGTHSGDAFMRLVNREFAARRFVAGTAKQVEEMEALISDMEELREHFDAKLQADTT